MSEQKEVRGYKVFNPDWTCRGFQYKVGENYELNETPIACERGYHFCKRLIDCYDYYTFSPENKVAEVTAYGEIDTKENKQCTNKIRIERKISWEEVLNAVNTGKDCTGYLNTGNGNSGNFNTGIYNSGDGNSGWRNGGHYNSGAENIGCNNSGISNVGDCNSGNDNKGHELDVTYYISHKNRNKEEDIQKNVEKAIQSYILWQKEVIGRDINPSELIRRIMEAGAKRAEVKLPIFTKIGHTELASCKAKTLLYGGLEYD